MLCRHQATRLHPPRAHIACSVLLSCQQLWKYIWAHTRNMELPCKSLQLFGLRVYNIGESCSCSSSLTYVPQCLSSSQIWSLLSDFLLSQMLTVITVQVWALSEFCGLICHFFFSKNLTSSVFSRLYADRLWTREHFSYIFKSDGQCQVLTYYPVTQITRSGLKSKIVPGIVAGNDSTLWIFRNLILLSCRL